MKTLIYRLLAVVTFLWTGGSATAAYGEIHTTWDSLRTIQLPSLEDKLYESIDLVITKVPHGAYGHLDSYGECAQLINWECDVSEEGKMRFLISNAFGYGPRYGPCGSQMKIEFGVVHAGIRKVQCQLHFRALGSRILPKVRIGEVVVRLEGKGLADPNAMVYIFPQIQLMYADESNPIWIKPHWKAKIEGQGFEPVWVEGWNDCSGMTKGLGYRSPCKPDPIALSSLRNCNGLVKITFDPKIVGLNSRDDIDLQFETDELSFWYDLLHDKRVER